MIQNTTFLRSKKLWIIVVLSAITAILVEPGRFTHPALQPNDYSAESFGVSDSNGGFFQLDSNQTRFDIVPGEYESVVASWTFLSSKKIELKSGVSNWAVQDEDGSAEVVYSVRQNQLVLLSDFKSRPGNSQTFILEVDSGLQTGAELTLLSLTEVIGGIFWVWLPVLGVNEIPTNNTFIGGFLIFISITYYSLIIKTNRRFIALN